MAGARAVLLASSLVEPSPVGISSMARQISKPDKTSLVINRAKAPEVREILGTKTLVETVDAAFDEVIRLAARRRILERIRRDGGVGPGPEELRRLRRPRGGPMSR